MTGAEVLSVVMARIGTGSGVTSIHRELKGVLYDLSGRADFLTDEAAITTAAGQADYDEPAGLKRVYECHVEDGGPLEARTYRDYLRHAADPTRGAGEPGMYARRHGKLWLWPVPDGEYAVRVDYARYHPEVFEEIAFGPEFSEAIFEGVIAALYQGQLLEKLRLGEKRITSPAGAGDTDVLVYRFDGEFPEARRHAEAYEAEIAKLIANMEVDAEWVKVEYRDV